MLTREGVSETSMDREAGEVGAFSGLWVVGRARGRAQGARG